MSFLEDINKAKSEQNSINEEIIKEIVEHFKGELASEKFESNLKNRIISNIQDNRTHTDITVHFWDYHSGCSETNFRISCCHDWTNHLSNWDSRYYKGVRLYDLRHEVTPILVRILSNKLDELGVIYSCCRTDTNNWLDYPTYTFEIKH